MFKEEKKVMLSVYDVSYLLSVSEETVRRWIRSGRLYASITSSKQGYIIDAIDLYYFLLKKPKYMSRVKSATLARSFRDALVYADILPNV